MQIPVVDQPTNPIQRAHCDFTLHDDYNIAHPQHIILAGLQKKLHVDIPCTGYGDIAVRQRTVGFSGLRRERSVANVIRVV